VLLYLANPTRKHVWAFSSRHLASLLAWGLTKDETISGEQNPKIQKTNRMHRGGIYQPIN
jgi:hypothetical protein